MKQLTKAFALLMLTSSVLSSCKDDNPWGGVDSNGGAIYLSLESDGSVLRSTRADDTKASIVPSPQEFGITLSRTDGSSNQKWANIDAFNKETSFPIGDYKIEAKFGDLETEGFTNPYYVASQNVSVTAGDEKTVNLRATLANAMVSIRYTDEFNNAYPQHSAAVRSAGHDYVVFAGDEIRPAYMYPSQISLSLTLTNQAGKVVTIQPAGFTAQARRHYVVTIGVTGSQEQGNLQLDVQFEENVISEVVNVSLGDDLFEADPPKIEAHNFVPGEAVKTFQNVATSIDPSFQIYAFGGLKEVNLSLVNSNYNSPFGKEVQLVNATSLVQSNVEASGLEVLGLFRKSDKMAIIKLKGFLEKLPLGTHTLQLEVVDAMTRRSEPMNFVAEVSPVSIIVRPAENVEFKSKNVVVYVSSNCPDIKNNTSFTVSQDNYETEIQSIETLQAAPVENLPEQYIYHYKYTLKSKHDLVRDNLPVKVFYGRKADEVTSTNMTMNFPKFTVEVDPMATLTKFRIVPENPELLDLICDELIILNEGKRVGSDKFIQMSGENGDGVMELLDLTPGTNYSNVEYCLSYTTNPRTAVPAFTTEVELDVNNGDFSSVSQSININNIQVGGQFYVGLTNYTISSSIVRNEADGWASLNPLTCYLNSSNKNTWFMVPSTYIENGEASIRTVGYSHNGNTPDRTNGGDGHYYCRNVPAESELTIQPGELFLGSYTFDGVAKRNDGIAFSSRPLSVSFKYKYTSVNNENAEIVVRVYDADGIQLNEGREDLSSTAKMIDKTVRIFDYPFGKKAAKLVLCFRSVSSKNKKPKVVFPTESELSEGLTWNNFTSSSARHLSANSYHALAVGSVLVVDDVKLGYKLSSSARQTAKKSRK